MATIEICGAALDLSAEGEDSASSLSQGTMHRHTLRNRLEALFSPARATFLVSRTVPRIKTPWWCRVQDTKIKPERWRKRRGDAAQWLGLQQAQRFGLQQAQRAEMEHVQRFGLQQAQRAGRRRPTGPNYGSPGQRRGIQRAMISSPGGAPHSRIGPVNAPASRHAPVSYTHLTLPTNREV